MKYRFAPVKLQFYCELMKFLRKVMRFSVLQNLP